jgi:hypothetical protein
MNNKYKYLHQFIENESDISRSNYFKKVKPEEISKAEQQIGFKFPEPLKDFWLEIGYGFLTRNIKGELDLHGSSNLILSPYTAAQTILFNEEESAILTFILEDCLEEGDVPFFHIGDSSDFLKFRLNSDRPEAIYDMYGDLIEESFEKFIWRLYHESPDYYLHLDEPKQL